MKKKRADDPSASVPTTQPDPRLTVVYTAERTPEWERFVALMLRKLAERAQLRKASDTQGEEPQQPG